jgi:hypothetical protein
MSALVRLYPAVWRQRYGEELEGLIADMSEHRRDSWRMRADVVRGAVRERARAAGLGAGSSPDQRIRGGILLVLWGWALFVLAGAIVQKTSEHWQGALPAAGRGQAAAGFGVLLGAAIGAGVLVVVGMAIVMPACARFLNRGGWPAVRRRVLVAAALTVVAVAATGGLVAAAHGVSASARDGHAIGYVVAFVAWAAVCAAALLAWTAAAVAIARRVALDMTTLRVEAGLAAVVTVLMVAMSVGAAVWWVAVADHAPGLLGGGSGLAWPLVVAMAAMLSATALGGVGTRQALRAAAGRG